MHNFILQLLQYSSKKIVYLLLICAPILYTCAPENSEEGLDINLPTVIVDEITHESIGVRWTEVSDAVNFIVTLAYDEALEEAVPGYAYRQLDPSINRFEFDNLNADSVYYFGLRVETVFGISKYTDATRIPTLLPPPSNLSVPSVSVGTNSFKIQWSPVDGATHYFLDVSRDKAFFDFVNGFNNLKVVNSFIDPIKTPPFDQNTTYFIRIRSVSEQGDESNISIFSDTITQATKIITPVLENPVLTSETSAKLEWEQIKRLTEYKVEYSTNDKFTPADEVTNITVDKDRTLHTVDGLKNNQRYYFRMRGINKSATSPYSNVVTISTSKIDEIQAPTIKEPTSVTHNSFIATWEPVDGATEYIVDIATDRNFTNKLSGFNNAVVLNNFTPVQGLSPNSFYYVRVKYKVNNEESSFSDVKSIHTHLFLSQPTILPFTNVTYRSFTINWNLVSDAENYVVEVSENERFTSYLPSYDNLYVTGSRLDIEGVLFLKDFYVRIRAQKGPSFSESSTVSKISTTTPPPPNTPVLSPPSFIDRSGFKISWSSVENSQYYIDVASDMNFNSPVSIFRNYLVNDTTFTITTLSPNQQYYFRVRSLRNNLTSNPTAGQPIHTKLVTPVMDKTTSIFINSFIANWSNVPGVNNYRIDVATDADFTSKVSGYDNRSVSNSTETVSGLADDTDYYVRVKAENSNTQSFYSDTIKVNTPKRPDPPTLFLPRSVFDTEFTMSWDLYDEARGFIIDIAKDKDFTDFSGGGIKETSVSRINTTFNVRNLTQNTKYYYRIKVLTGIGESLYTGENSVTTKETIPLPPTVSSASSITSTSFFANWLTTARASKFFVDVSVNNAFTVFISGFNNKEVDGASTTTLQVNGLSPGTTYYYRVRAGNTGGNSASSSTQVVTTSIDAPTGLTFSSVSSTGFTTTWGSVTGATDYLLYVSTQSDFSTHVVNGLSTGGATTYSVSSLTPSTTYYWRVAARNNNPSAVPSQPSSASLLTTSATGGGLLVPQALTPSTVNSTDFTARWNSVTGATQYEIDVATDSGFTTIVYTRNSLTGTSHVVSPLTNNTTYYYRIRAKNASTTTSNSNVITVTTSM